MIAMWDALWINARIATMVPGKPFGLIAPGAVAAEGGRIAWVGAMAALPGTPAALAVEVHDAADRVMTPGLVDCHTHVVFTGDGLVDFEVLTRGGGRAEMVAAGGGIIGMVMRNRAADPEKILAESRKRVARLIASGVTTLESKSGAGLDLDTEIATMAISRELGRLLPVTVVSTYLGAHGIAPEYRDRLDDYVAFMTDTVLPEALRRGLVDQVDGFCDAWGYTPVQMARLFEAATAAGLPVKLHAEQYRDFGAAELVARFRGLSADHLEYVGEPAVRAMADSGTVATLLPGANWTLGERRRPPVDLFRRHGVPIALATNCNPVSSPTTSPTMMMNMGCRMFGLTTEEALAAFTRVGAKALGLAASRGTIEVGKQADLAVWDVTQPGELASRIADNPCVAVVKDGRVVHRAVEPRFAA
jgi:imidazolonepropionase